MCSSCPPPTVYVNEASCCQTPVRNLFLLMQHLHVFPFSPWLYYTVFQNMRYKLKIDLEGGAVTTFCAAPMTSLLQGASFTVGMINSDRREFLGLLWLLSFAETKEMIARERIIIMEFSSDAHLSVYPFCISCACLMGTPDSYWTGGNEDSEQFHNNLSWLGDPACQEMSDYFSEFP